MKRQEQVYAIKRARRLTGLLLMATCIVAMFLASPREARAISDGPGTSGIRQREKLKVAPGLAGGEDASVVAMDELKAEADERTDVFVPVAGSLEGKESSPVRSMIWIYNLDSVSAKVQFFFLKMDQPNLSPAVYNDTLAPAKLRRYDDPVEMMFGETGRGVLHVVSDRKVLVRSSFGDASLDQASGDSLRQFFAAVPAGFAMGAGQKVKLLGTWQVNDLPGAVPSSRPDLKGDARGGYRLQSVPKAESERARASRQTTQSEYRPESVPTSPFGLVETTGGGVIVRLSAFDEAGTVITAKEYPLAGFEPRQHDLSQLLPTTLVGPLKLEVEVVSGRGKVIAFGTCLASDATTAEDLSAREKNRSVAGGEQSSAKQIDKTVNSEGATTPGKTQQGGSVTGSGDRGRIALWTGVGTLGSSSLDQSRNGNLHINDHPSEDEFGRLYVDADGDDGVAIGASAFGKDGIAISGLITTGSIGVLGVSLTSGRGVEGRSKTGPGVKGESDSERGVYGTSKTSTGVFGESDKLYGVAGVSKGGGFGVLGKAEGGAMAGVRGLGAGEADGVRGEAEGGGRGVYGEATSGVAVFGKSDSGRGVYGQSTKLAGVAGLSEEFHGVSGLSRKTFGVNGIGEDGALGGVSGFGRSGGTNGVMGEASGSGRGVYGKAASGDAVFGESRGRGVHGQSIGSGDGVFGESASGTGLHGKSTGSGDGVFGESSTGRGVYGKSTDTGDGVFGESMSRRGVQGVSDNVGVEGRHRSGAGRGVQGVSQKEIGVAGFSTSNTGAQGLSETGVGIAGFSETGGGVFGSSESGRGVEGHSKTRGGVVGFSESGTATGGVGMIGDGLFGTSNSGKAGVFGGNVVVTGNITVAVKFFHIDHPLDPANKYLNHASVESAEMKNIYDGVVVLDSAGEAVVELPEWLEALNREFRYQLTAMGAPGSSLYVAEKMKNHRFNIAGGMPGMEVSWQVTGIRHDAYAKAHPIVVEEEKSGKERGTYMHPELFGQPEEKGYVWLDHAEFMQQLKVMKQAKQGQTGAKPALPIP